jgi:hypothetical protein
MRYIFLFIIFIPLFVFSQIASYDFNNCLTSPSYVLPGFSATNVTTTANLHMGCSLGCGMDYCGGVCSTTTSFLTSGWNTVNVDLGKYYEFTVSSPGVSFYLTYLFFEIRKSDTGPIKFSVYLDGVPISVLLIANHTNCQTFGVGINQLRSESSNLKIHFWGASSASGTVRLNNVILDHDFTTLPVELLYFTGSSDIGYVNLNWATATETNNSHFEVQKSHNGIDFYKISSVFGFGNSQSTIEYRYQDLETNSNTTYYRLKQFDFDGNHTYSDIISIDTHSDFIISDHVISYSGPSKASIYDLYGQLVWNFDWGKFAAHPNTIYFVKIGDRNIKLALK